MDTDGLIIGAAIHSAQIQDRDGALLPIKTVAEDPKKGIKKLIADGAYAGQCAARIAADTQWTVEVIRRPNERIRGIQVRDGDSLPTEPKGFVVVRTRWIVERTFAWLGRHRRLSKDYEHLPCRSLGVLWLAATALLVARLGRMPRLQPSQ